MKRAFLIYMHLTKRWLFILRVTFIPKQYSDRWKDLDARLKEGRVNWWEIKLLGSINSSGPSGCTDLPKPQLQVWVQSHYKCCKHIQTELKIMLRTKADHQVCYCLQSSYYQASKNYNRRHLLTLYVYSSCLTSISSGTGGRIWWKMLWRIILKMIMTSKSNTFFLLLNILIIWWLFLTKMT